MVGFNFADGLRAVLRQDPDVILVGEIRDQETAEISMRASLTGHLVLTTVHTTDAATALTRLLDMGIEPFLIAAAPTLIINQRLLRRVCDGCKAQIELPGILPEKLDTLRTLSGPFYKAVGCAACSQTGYRGRMPIFEILKADIDIQKLIMKKVSAEEIRAAATKQGVKTLVDDATRLLAEGATTVDEILKIVTV